MISIVVPTRGHSSLVRLLDSLKVAQDRDLSEGLAFREIEIVVSVDTGHSGLGHSRPGHESPATVEAVSDLIKASPATARVIGSSGKGVNAARNRGAQVSRGGLIWFLDDDVELAPDFRFSDLDRIFRDESVLGAGGEYLCGPRATWDERGYNALSSVWRHSAGREGRELLLGGTLAVRRSAWEEVRGFDSEIEYGGAETSFVLRLHQLGGRIVFQQELNVIHHPGSRGLVRWWSVAFRQARRRSETARELPKLLERIVRTLNFLPTLKLKSVVCLLIFGLPFLVVSTFSRTFHFLISRSGGR